MQKHFDFLVAIIEKTIRPLVERCGKLTKELRDDVAVIEDFVTRHRTATSAFDRLVAELVACPTPADPKTDPARAAIRTSREANREAREAREAHLGELQAQYSAAKPAEQAKIAVAIAIAEDDLKERRARDLELLADLAKLDEAWNRQTAKRLRLELAIKKANAAVLVLDEESRGMVSLANQIGPKLAKLAQVRESNRKEAAERRQAEEAARRRQAEEAQELQRQVEFATHQLAAANAGFDGIEFEDVRLDVREPELAAGTQPKLDPAIVVLMEIEGLDPANPEHVELAIHGASENELAAARELASAAA